MSRIAIVDRTRLRVVDVVRKNAVDLSAHGDARLANRQPAWSPDGGRLAWSAFDRRQSDSPALLVVASAEASTRTDFALIFPAFYVAWRPDGAVIATLGEGPLGLELTITDLANGTNEIVHRGAPLFFSWSADSAALAIHAHTDETATLDVHGARYDRDAFAALLAGPPRPPLFAADGSVIATIDQTGIPTLVQLDASARVMQTLGVAIGDSRTVIDAAGQRLATLADASPAEGIVTYNVVSGVGERVAVQSPALFSWSPNGEHLLIGRVAERGDFPMLEWCTWTNGELTVHTRGRTTATFGREVLPFFDQYAISHTWWSPDSSAFCYAALDDYGNDAAWMVRLDDPTPERVATGSLAVWSTN